MWFTKAEIIQTVIEQPSPREPEPAPTPLEKYEQACGELAAIQTTIGATEKELRRIFAVRDQLFGAHQHQQRVLVDLKKAAGLLKEAT